MSVGWKQIEDDWYYSDISGVLQHGWQNINGKWYFFDDDYGDMYSDNWVYDQYKDYWYYIKPNGEMAIGWYWFDQYW